MACEQGMFGADGQVHFADNKRIWAKRCNIYQALGMLQALYKCSLIYVSKHTGRKKLHMLPRPLTDKKRPGVHLMF